ncbi:hypothetical protein, partial [Anaerotruncus colihominis]|uniref:hypothetical protein n=1 Tax=Anaerotruncus colihominis TaxID=169435 RepID=UPI0029429A8F
LRRCSPIRYSHETRTIAGVKPEDTYLIDGGRREIITQRGSWPLREVSLDGASIKRPLVLKKVIRLLRLLWLK